MKKQRIVVKIGSSSLTDESGALCYEKLEGHVEAMATLFHQGHEVILITSGAVAAGFRTMGYPTKPKTVAGKQAAASVGQGLLMQAYISAFQKHKIVIGQLLLTRSDFESKERFQNAHSTLTELLNGRVLPIINENDSVSIEELTFGDNDMLSALVSGFVHADFLILLTDINGIYDDNPKENPNAKKYHYLPDITEELLAAAGDSGSKVGTGGMKSKVLAAKKAHALGVGVFIGTGEGKEKLIDILSGKGDGTYIGVSDSSHRMQTKKQWIGLHSHSNGKIMIDQGAEHALVHKGKSLLPAGIHSVEGHFEAHVPVEIVNEKGQIIGKGVTNYSSTDIEKIKGLPLEDAKLYSKSIRAEVIHRDYLVLL